jgi:hypothetical protein
MMRDRRHPLALQHRVPAFAQRYAEPGSSVPVSFPMSTYWWSLQKGAIEGICNDYKY